MVMCHDPFARLGSIFQCTYYILYNMENKERTFGDCNWDRRFYTGSKPFT